MGFRVKKSTAAAWVQSLRGFPREQQTELRPVAAKPLSCLTYLGACPAPGCHLFVKEFLRPVNKEGKDKDRLRNSCSFDWSLAPCAERGWEVGGASVCSQQTKVNKTRTAGWGPDSWGQLDEESLSKKILGKNRKLKIDVTHMQNISWKSVPVHSTSP